MPYNLVPLTNTEQLIEEGNRMHNALALPDYHEIILDNYNINVYSLRDALTGISLMSIGVRDNAVINMVIANNAEPPMDLVCEAEALLREQGITLDLTDGIPRKC